MANNIEQLYTDINTIKEMLEEVMTVSLAAASTAESFGGEIDRVAKSQLRDDVVGSIKILLGSSSTGINGILKLLQDIPLSAVVAGSREYGTGETEPMTQGLGQDIGFSEPGKVAPPVAFVLFNSRARFNKKERLQYCNRKIKF